MVDKIATVAEDQGWRACRQAGRRGHSSAQPGRSRVPRAGCLAKDQAGGVTSYGPKRLGRPVKHDLRDMARRVRLARATVVLSWRWTQFVQTGLCRQIPCYQGNLQGIPRKPASGADLAPKTAHKIKGLRNNSLQIRAGN
jgi:hypothetical protein